MAGKNGDTRPFTSVNYSQYSVRNAKIARENQSAGNNASRSTANRSTSPRNTSPRSTSPRSTSPRSTTPRSASTRSTSTTNARSTSARPASVRNYENVRRSRPDADRARSSRRPDSAYSVRQQQRREYAQQKKEKLIFGLVIVIILVMILFAILFFKKVLGDGTPTETESGVNNGIENSDTGEIGNALNNDKETAETDETGSENTDRLPSVPYRNEVHAKEDIYNGTLILIDSSHPYRDNENVQLSNISESRVQYENATAASGKVFSFYVGNMSLQLESETLKALNSFANDFYKTTGNYDLFVDVDSAYVKNSSDEHATGRAFDLSAWLGEEKYFSLDKAEISANFNWIRANYYKYGFVRRASSDCSSKEPYHFLYVGVPHAYYMYKNSLGLEEYWTLLRSRHTYADGGKNNLSFTAEDGSRYEVYYVPANGDVVNLPVPEQCESYTVSGDNVGGFAVTVKLK